jgi:ferritin-like metal-binding protein YciE
MAKIRTMEELFEHELEDLLSAEQQLVEALPKMAEAASNSSLKTAFKDHLKETKTHVTRIEKAFKKLGKEPKAHTCKGMQGLIKEGEDLIKNATDAAVLDAGLISAAQRVEHYEISAYGSARAHAQALGHTELVDLLQTSLDEEGAANKLLTQLAEGRMSFSGANEKALA